MVFSESVVSKKIGSCGAMPVDSLLTSVGFLGVLSFLFINDEI